MDFNSARTVHWMPFSKVRWRLHEYYPRLISINIFSEQYAQSSTVNLYLWLVITTSTTDLACHIEFCLFWNRPPALLLSRCSMMHHFRRSVLLTKVNWTESVEQKNQFWWILTLFKWYSFTIKLAIVWFSPTSQGNLPRPWRVCRQWTWRSQSVWRPPRWGAGRAACPRGPRPTPARTAATAAGRRPTRPPSGRCRRSRPGPRAPSFSGTSGSRWSYECLCQGVPITFNSCWHEGGAHVGFNTGNGENLSYSRGAS